MPIPKDYGVKTLYLQVGPWSQTVGKSVAFVNNRIKSGEIETVMIGRHRHILISPEEYDRRLVEEQRAPRLDLTKYGD
jgi:hypothetical protein